MTPVTGVVLFEATGRTIDGLGGLVLAREKKSAAVANVGSTESSGDRLEFEVGGCSPSGDVRASKKQLSSLTGVNAGRRFEKLDLVLMRPLANGRLMLARGASLARFSRSSAALRESDFEMRVVEPSDICFLWPKAFPPFPVGFGVTLSSDCEAGNDVGVGFGKVSNL